MELIETPDFLRLDQLQPKIKEVLNDWSKEHDLFIVTMRNKRKGLLWQLEQFDILKYFKKVFNQDNNIGNWKVKYNLIRDSINENSIIIGDTEADIIAGQKLGISTIAVGCGIRKKDYLKELNPDHIFDELVKAIDLKQTPF